MFQSFDETVSLFGSQSMSHFDEDKHLVYSVVGYLDFRYVLAMTPLNVDDGDVVVDDDDEDGDVGDDVDSMC